MDFSINGGASIEDPTPQDITTGLASLTGTGDSFAILASSEMTYLQASGGPSHGFVIEYQVDSLDQHYQSVSNSLPLSTVTTAFQRYAVSDPSWKSVTGWQHLDLSGASSFPPVMGLVVLALGLAAASRWLRRPGRSRV
jgi:hypothetical protein